MYLTNVRQLSYGAPMTETEQSVPTWTLGWRLQQSLAFAGLSVEQMADELGASRSSLSRWMNDRGSPPKAAYVKLWALKCGVPYEWLIYGDSGLPRVDSNHQPAGLCTDLQPSRDEILAFRKTIRRPANDRAVTVSANR